MNMDKVKRENERLVQENALLKSLLLNAQKR